MLVVTARNTVHSVLFLVANFLCVAIVFVVLAAEFLAVIQVLVYAGGIVVLYLFVVMLVNLKSAPEAPIDPRRQARLGFGLRAVLLAEGQRNPRLHGSDVRRARSSRDSGAGPAAATLKRSGWLLYTEYLVPFEVVSMLLLVAMIGAIILARKEP